MGKELLNRKEIIKESFNSRVIEITDVADFLQYFSAILQIAYELELIGIERRNAIAEYIVKAIPEMVLVNMEFDNKNVAISNYLYVLTMYLQSKSNWEAWVEMSNINSVADAKEFLAKPKIWINNRLIYAKSRLGNIRKKVLKLGLKNITQCYQGLVRISLQLQTFYYFNVGLQLSTIHTNQNLSELGSYVFLKEENPNVSNFLERLDEIIINFSMEVSILDTIGATGIIHNKRKEAIYDRCKDFAEIEKLDKSFRKRLAKLKRERDDKLDYYFESLHRPGRKRKGCSDEVEIEQEYFRKKLAIEKVWQKQVNRLKKEKEESDFLKTELLMDDYSLVDIIKEYAIFLLAQNKKIEYPESLEKRAILIRSLDIGSAIDEIINGINNLTDVQKSYLSKCK